MSNETITAEQYIDALQQSAQIMYITINAVFELHAPIDSDDDTVLCEHCSSIGGTSVTYPCQTSTLLLADMVIEDATSSETSEPAESEEPSS